jgi:hypothetical protein
LNVNLGLAFVAAVVLHFVSASMMNPALKGDMRLFARAYPYARKAALLVCESSRGCVLAGDDRA